MSANINRCDFEYLRNLIQKTSGIALEDSKEYLVESRLKPVLLEAGCGSIQDLVNKLKTRSSERLGYRVVEAMVTGETFFFRNGHPFDALQKAILPDLIGNGTNRLNIWCAAASSGQEPYSLAMLLTDRFPQLDSRRFRLIASDLSEALLERARAGCYNQVEIERGLPPSLLEKYFRKQGEIWQLSEQIRRKVEFLGMNLIQGWPDLPAMDLVLLRNVLIYFDEATRGRIIGKMRALIRPGGYLLLGTSESLSVSEPGFEQLQFGRTVCYRRCAGAETNQAG